MRLVGGTDTNLLISKGVQHNDGQRLYPVLEPRLPSVRTFPVPLEAAPQVPQGARGSRVWPGPCVRCSPAARARSWVQTESPAPLLSETCTREVTAARAQRRSRWCYVATVGPPTFCSMGGEPNLLARGQWEGAGFIFHQESSGSYIDSLFFIVLFSRFFYNLQLGYNL